MTKLKISLPQNYLEDTPVQIVVPAERKKIWAVLLDLLVEFDRVCKKHGIVYYLDSGTLIGAARHSGFIPWDDDIDVNVTRDGYDKLEQLALAGEFKHPYFFQTFRTDPGSDRCHAKLRNSDTTAILACDIENEVPCYRFNQGLFLDVFALDNIPDDLCERDIFLNEMCVLRDRISYISACRRLNKNIPFWKALFHPRLLKRWFSPVYWNLLGRFKGVDVLALASEDLQQMARKYNSVPTEYMAPVEHRPRRKPHEFYRSEDFKHLSRMRFEGFEFPVPAHYDRLLTDLYGNWHKQLIEASAHGSFGILDIETSYVKYLV